MCPVREPLFEDSGAASYTGSYGCPGGMRLLPWCARKQVSWQEFDLWHRRRSATRAAHGLILSLDHFNAPYDRMLRMKLPQNTYLTSYVDDIAAVARDFVDTQRRLYQVMKRVSYARVFSGCTSRSHFILHFPYSNVLKLLMILQKFKEIMLTMAILVFIM